MNDDVEGDEMWFLNSRGMLLFIICKSNNIRVLGLLSKQWGQNGFSYVLPSDKGRMLMNS